MPTNFWKLTHKHLLKLKVMPPLGRNREIPSLMDTSVNPAFAGFHGKSKRVFKKFKGLKMQCKKAIEVYSVRLLDFIPTPENSEQLCISLISFCRIFCANNLNNLLHFMVAFLPWLEVSSMASAYLGLRC